VLVTLQDGEPVPKVIDFGIAKALRQKLTKKTLTQCAIVRQVVRAPTEARMPVSHARCATCCATATSGIERYMPRVKKRDSSSEGRLSRGYMKQFVSF
jgi:hypothetical protein